MKTKGQEFLKKTKIINNIETKLREIEKELEDLAKETNELLTNDDCFDLWDRIIKSKREVFEGRIIIHKKRNKLIGISFNDVVK
jgi:phage terminase small subunit